MEKSSGRIPIVCGRIWLAELFARRNRLKKTEIMPITRGEQLRGRHPEIIIVLRGWNNHKSWYEYADIDELLAYQASKGSEVLVLDDLVELPARVKLAFGIKDRGSDVEK